MADFRIAPFRFWCQKILPLSYDDSLSYYEALCKISGKMNEIIDMVNSYKEEYISYVNEQIENLKRYVDENDEELNHLILELHDQAIQHTNDSVLNLKNEVYSDIEKINHELSVMKLFIIADQNRQDKDIERKLKRLYQDVEKLLKKVNGMVINPVFGGLTSIQQALDDIYNYLRYDAFTCFEFDGMNETCEYWDSLKFTAYEFDLYGSRKYGKRRCDCYMFDPFTGELKKVPDVIYDMVSRQRDSYTCQEYDALEITATVFTQKEITALQFDAESKLYLN